MIVHNPLNDFQLFICQRPVPRNGEIARTPIRAGRTLATVGVAGIIHPEWAAVVIAVSSNP